MNTVLIVDDVAAIAQQVANELSHHQFQTQVFVTQNVDDAINCIRQSAPDILVLDISWTDRGSEGISVAKRVRDWFQGQVIMHSSFSRQKQFHMTREYGIEHCVDKLNVEAILDCINETCDCGRWL